MQRRSVFAAAFATLLAGCGFQLRQAPEFAFDTIVINAPQTSPLAAELRKAFRQDGKVRVITGTLAPAAAPAPAGAASAPVAVPGQVIFDLLQEQREKVVVGLNASGQVREYQLRSRIHFRVRTPLSRELIPDTELLQQRDISFNETAVLAKESEEVLLYRDMQNDLVQQLMRRLGALKAL
ncbi:LPS assembly lipoprotein LptE [Ramlibacter sp. PS3R-8]|uniref:LPS-assembly lipoprotein LptE n=1 Tax=Ramlibacter sp. PS3R-8 TaxID=3133437 RepID=UPI0030A7A6CC